MVATGWNGGWATGGGAREVDKKESAWYLKKGGIHWVEEEKKHGSGKGARVEGRGGRGGGRGAGGGLDQRFCESRRS